MGDWPAYDEVLRPLQRWRDAQRSAKDNPPNKELGRNLETIEDVDTWLSHPSNWFRGQIYIIRWDGCVPMISEEQAWQLAPGSFSRDMMLKVVLSEHQRRKRGGYKESEPAGEES